MSRGSSSDRIFLAEGLLWATWLALIAAMLELCLLFLPPMVTGRVGFMNPHAGWMVPAFHVFAAIGAVTATCGLLNLRRRRCGRRFVVFVAAAYASGAVLVILHPRVHKLAIASLAVGLAFQFARMASRRSGVVTFMRRSIPWLAAFLAVAGFYSGALAPVLQRPRNPSQASTGSGAPNVLLIILDTVRALSVGVTPLGRETTPFLNGLQKRATTFQHAVAPAPWTTPTHASLLTGLWPHELADPWHPPYTLPGTLPSLPRVLADHANSLYRTALEVPLFIADPRSTKAVVVADPVSLRDLAATMLDLAAVPSALPGASLRPLMNGEDHVEVSLALSSLSPFPRPVSYVPIARGEMSSLITSRWHYILNGDGREELFDVTMAADQEEDLAASPEQVSVLESMRALVQALRPHRNR